MMNLTSDQRRALARMRPDGWELRSPLVRKGRDDGPPVGWIVAGVVALGLGYMAWTYLGPDLRRYLKIHSM